jgi:hypothetical protein
MMWKTARVVALALAMFGSMSFAHNGFAAANAEEHTGSTASGGVVVTEAAIARLKAALRLSPAQEIHWRSLESTLRHLAQDQQTRVADASGSVGFVQRIKSRMKSYVLDVSAARQVAAAAQPLIATLDEDQRRDGMMMVRALGVSALF